MMTSNLSHNKVNNEYAGLSFKEQLSDYFGVNNEHTKVGIKITNPSFHPLVLEHVF